MPMGMSDSGDFVEGFEGKLGGTLRRRMGTVTLISLILNDDTKGRLLVSHLENLGQDYKEHQH